MKGLSARSLSSWIAVATSSLPTPLSPVISTLARLGATCPTSSIRAIIFWLLPMIFPYLVLALISASSLFSRSCSSYSLLVLRDLRTTRIRRSRSTGLVKKSTAPSRMATTAVSMVPCPVRMMTGRRGYAPCTFCNSSSPLIPSMRRSVIRRSTSFLPINAQASSPLEAVRVWNPSSWKARARPSRIFFSSSQINRVCCITAPPRRCRRYSCPSR